MMAQDKDMFMLEQLLRQSRAPEAGRPAVSPLVMRTTQQTTQRPQPQTLTLTLTQPVPAACGCSNCGIRKSE
jgi:hypothetical protein